MLDNTSLSQLKALKQQFEDTREYAEGSIKATHGRFGFLVSDQGQEIYLPPDEMNKVFPGDRVEALIIRDPGKKPRAVLEKVLHSPVRFITGRYSIRGKGHFIEPDLANCQHLLFVPPDSRKQARDGEWVLAKVSRHPAKGKPQARILQCLGTENEPGVESRYAAAKHQLPSEWPEHKLFEPDETGREDLSALPFISIDGASTRDIDDALYAEPNADGWTLWVAIADPVSVIGDQSALLAAIADRASAVYFPGNALSMLPETVAYDQCSLLAGQQRAALICRITVSCAGDILSYQLFPGWIRNHRQLSYAAADAALQGEPLADAAQQQSLDCLDQLSTALNHQRRDFHLLIDERPDYEWELDERGKIGRIKPRQKLGSHRLVEECMVAANRCAAEFLGAQGVFVHHPGFRPERHSDVHKLAEEQLQLTGLDITGLEGYRQLMTAAGGQDGDLPLKAVLSRLLTRSELSLTAQPHFGMALPRYTTFTSPLRRYPDFLVHRLIHQRFTQLPAGLPSSDQLAELQLRLDRNRRAQQEAEQWLKCQYLLPLQGQQATGTIVQINSRGFTVQLDDNGIEGVVETRALDEKFSFDPMRLRLRSATRSFQLLQPVTVVIENVDCRRRQIRLLPVASAPATTAVAEKPE